MINNKIHTPAGVRDLLPPEAMVKKELINKIDGVFKSYGFTAVETPTFEFIEVFSEETGSVSQKQMYKLFDRDGQTLALRSDMTPPIARVAATAYSTEQFPIRLCYFQNAFRYNENYKGKLREFTQAGVELIGVSSIDADSEVVAVAIDTLIASGLTDFRIDIGQVKFFEGIIEEAGFDADKKLEIQQLIVNKDYYGAQEVIQNENIPISIKKLFIELPMLVGQKDILEKARKLTGNEKALKALDQLDEIYDVLCSYGIEKYVAFDLGMLNNLNYYTGIIFKGYTYGTGFSILDGGRYDNLIGQFGSAKPSVGFAVKITDLMDVIFHQKIDISLNYADTLLVYNEKSKNTALAVGKTLRGMGLLIENSLLGSDFEVNKKYALSKKMGGVINFLDKENIQVVNFKDNTVTVKSITELTKGLC